MPLRPPVGTGVSGRPLVNLSFALNYAVHELDFRGYHAVNLLIHAATALALYGVVRRTLVLPRVATIFGDAANGLALLTAVLWAVHPLLTDSVSYISGRTELLVALFMLLALYAAIRRWTIVSICCGILAAGSKEIAVALPLLVFLYDRTFVAGTFVAALRQRPLLYAGLLAVIPIVAINLWTADFHRVALKDAATMGTWTYLKIQAEVLVMYLRLSFWPHPLILDYLGWRSDATLAQVLPSALLIVGLLGVTAYGVARSRPIAYAGAWFFLILAPTSSILPLPTEVATERRMYLPLMAVVAAVVLGAAWVVRIVARRFPAARGGAVAAAAALLVVGAAALRTVARNEDYKDPIALWADVAARRPNAARAYVNLSYEFWRRNQLAEARECFIQVARLDETDYSNRNNLAILLHAGDTAEAERYLREALAIKPDYDYAYQNLGMIALERGHLDEAERYLRESVRLAPNRADNRQLLGKVLAAREAGKAK